jgi:hypothetical protein
VISARSSDQCSLKRAVRRIDGGQETGNGIPDW